MCKGKTNICLVFFPFFFAPFPNFFLLLINQQDRSECVGRKYGHCVVWLVPLWWHSMLHLPFISSACMWYIAINHKSMISLARFPFKECCVGTNVGTAWQGCCLCTGYSTAQKVTQPTYQCLGFVVCTNKALYNSQRMSLENVQFCNNVCLSACRLALVKHLAGPSQLIWWVWWGLPPGPQAHRPTIPPGPQAHQAFQFQLAHCSPPTFPPVHQQCDCQTYTHIINWSKKVNTFKNYTSVIFFGYQTYLLYRGKDYLILCVTHAYWPLHHHFYCNIPLLKKTGRHLAIYLVKAELWSTLGAW